MDIGQRVYIKRDIVIHLPSMPFTIPRHSTGTIADIQKITDPPYSVLLDMAICNRMSFKIDCYPTEIGPLGEMFYEDFKDKIKDRLK